MTGRAGRGAGHRTGRRRSNSHYQLGKPGRPGWLEGTLIASWAAAPVPSWSRLLRLSDDRIDQPEDDRRPGQVAPDHLPWRRASVLMVPPPAMIIRCVNAWTGAHRHAGETSAGEFDCYRGAAATWCQGRGGRARGARPDRPGLTALAWPSVPARPWVGAAADDLAARVFGRALGARDIALGLGALTALQRPAAEPGSACAWVAAGALSDALDVVASLSSWRELPRIGRWLVAVSAGGAALTGAAGALAVRPNRNGGAT